MTISEEFLARLQENKSITDHYGGSSPVATRSVRKVWVFDVQWSDCPRFIEEEVKRLWENHSLGNDYFIVKLEMDKDLQNSYPLIAQWLEFNGVPFGETVWVHWWW